MSTEYAGTLYDTTAEATRAAIYDWASAHGSFTEAQVVEDLEGHVDAHAEELADLVSRGEWHIPGVDDADDPAVARELLLDLLEDLQQ